MWSASPRDDPLHSSLRWSRAVGCWVVFETCFLNVGHPGGGGGGGGGGSGTDEDGGGLDERRWWQRRRPGPPRRFIDRRCAHLLAMRALSPKHALLTPAPRFSGPTAARAAQC